MPNRVAALITPRAAGLISNSLKNKGRATPLMKRMKPVKNLPAAASDLLSKVPSTHIGSSSMWSCTVFARGWAGNSLSHIEHGASFPCRLTVMKQFSRVHFFRRVGLFDAEHYPLYSYPSASRRSLCSAWASWWHGLGSQPRSAFPFIRICCAMRRGLCWSTKEPTRARCERTLAIDRSSQPSAIPSQRRTGSRTSGVNGCAG
jgi:hypothetical protein